MEAVVFDLDGVLIDSEPVSEQVRRDYMEQNGGHWARGCAGPVDGDEHLPGP